MATDFSRTLSLLRQEKGVSQRKAAGELGISQALLSHYENGIREPGLAFVVKACAYYHVSADFLLGRTLNRDGSIIEAEDVYDSSGEKGSLRGSILATLQKKLVVNTRICSPWPPRSLTADWWRRICSYAPCATGKRWPLRRGCRS